MGYDMEGGTERKDSVVKGIYILRVGTKTSMRQGGCVDNVFRGGREKQRHFILSSFPFFVPGHSLTPKNFTACLENSEGTELGTIICEVGSVHNGGKSSCPGCPQAPIGLVCVTLCSAQRRVSHLTQLATFVIEVGHKT
jgi:hypothetical protein